MNIQIKVYLNNSCPYGDFIGSFLTLDAHCKVEQSFSKVAPYVIISAVDE